MVSENTVYSALDFTAGKIRGIGDVPLTASTPCTEWNLGQVLNHMINALDLMGRGLAGEGIDRASLDPEATAATPISGAPEAAFAAAAARARTVFADPGIWDRELTGAFSGDCARDVAGVVVGDVTAHGWDIARATGQDETVPEPLVDEAYAFARGFLRPELRGALFGPEVQLGPDATKTRQLMAFLGRQP
ncbi:TIGR03086 family protein [Nocardiopsis gilva YIM 90087]|uniref:TIGR03086 family protein n=1 Tax=Nocardiopsis gilva YIM 90087 TaxID=1235441 RepID=A0A223S3F5_9ACTN|nr:TIGR03086 family metal-binding protein [Nocardiopsis gilva]ASU82651.1 TIGR03086 family protein [Nocardiopsis gilva YIM 90087]